jgi:alcohol dehydrogenase class IV
LIISTDYFFKDFISPNVNILFIVGKNVLENSIKLNELKNQLEISSKVTTIIKNSKLINENDVLSLIDVTYKFEIILCVGGGSVIDYAKSIIFHNLSKRRNDFKFFAIPTTCGSGSESTEFAVVYNDNIKKSLYSKILKPDYVILDKDFLNEIPNLVLWSSISDSFCQAIESLWSKNANTESLEYSIKALSLFKEGINNFINLDKEKLLKASYYSGNAINISKTTAPHAFSYYLTTMHNIPHGFAVLFTLEEFLKINLSDNLFKANFFDRINYIFKDYSDIILVIKKILKQSKYKYPITINSFNKCEKYINLERLNNNPVSISSSQIKKIYINSFNNLIDK